MNIICLLSVRPSIKIYNFFKSIKLNTPYDVYIVIDDNNYTIPDYQDDGTVKIINKDGSTFTKKPKTFSNKHYWTK